MTIVKSLKSLFTKKLNTTKISGDSVSDILFFVADLIRNKAGLEKEIASLKGVSNFSPAVQKDIASQLYKRFESVLCPLQYSKDDLRKMVRDRFGDNVIKNSCIFDLMSPDESEICRLKARASEISRELIHKTGRSVLWDFINQITDNTLLSGLVLCSTGDIDFSLPENRMSKLPPALVNNYDNLIRYFVNSLEDFNLKTKKQTDIKNEERPAVFLDDPDDFSLSGFATIFDHGALSDLPAKMISKDGEHIPVSLSGNVLKMKDGNIQGMVLVAKDMRKLRDYARDRLEKITPILQKVALGDFSEKVKIPDAEDEFTEHMIALNRMIDDFQEMVTEIHHKQEELEKAKEGLEDKIKQRTAELEKSKTSLEAEVEKRTIELSKAKDKLEEEVQNRTKELQEKLLELERFNKVAVGRELKMVELKERIATLEEERDECLLQSKQ